MFKQMPEYFESFFFSKYQCGFRKGFSAQHCLVSILEQWKSTTDNKKAFGALLTDLSNTFDCLSHDLLIAKLNTYEFNMSALRFVHSYLKNPMQRTKKTQTVVLGKKLCFGFYKGLYLGLNYLIYSYVIYSLLWKTLTLQAMQMITRHTAQ